MMTTTSGQPEPLAVTQVEAARRLTVSDRTIRRWEKKGLLTGTRRQGVKLYPFARLKELAGVVATNDGNKAA
jgi:DNA-binding transcriptional MerR regulator